MLAPRAVFDQDQEQYRDLVRKVIAREIDVDNNECAHIAAKGAWRKVGEAGMLCATVPKAYGGPRLDFCYDAVVNEEVAYAGSSAGFTLHSDIVTDDLVAYGSEEQKRAYLPQMVSGELITAIAMTEPGTGSDLQAIRTTAIRAGNHYVVNGSKTFIAMARTPTDHRDREDRPDARCQGRH